MATTVVVPIDTGEPSSYEQVLPVAVRHAEDHGATLHLLTVVERIEINLAGAPSSEVINAGRRDDAEATLNQISAAWIPPEVAHEQHVRLGNVHREILALAEETAADLIIMASHRPALSTYLLGAHAARVVRHARCSVYVVRSPC